MATRIRVRYYETDAMGIVHHSNYIRWFEVARTEFLRDSGISYRGMEEDGIQVPVLEAACRYRSPARFDDDVTVETVLSGYTGTRVSFAYTVRRGDTVLCTGTTAHAFLMGGRPVSLARSAPQYHAALEAVRV